MKILNFTAIEILPALLDKSKVQTIRQPCKCKHHQPSGQHYKIGDQIKLLWNQRSKARYFCKYCGQGIGKPFSKWKNWVPDNSEYHDSCFNQAIEEKGIMRIFSKHIGNAEITEVFKIKYGKNCLESPRSSIDLAHADGFPNSIQMFKWFDEKYDLSQPKEFWVYRWKVLI